MDRDDYGELVGHCGVDSGQIMVVDPCYVKSWKDGDAFPDLDWDNRDEELDARVKAYEKGEYEPKNDYESACLATMSEKKAGSCFGNSYRRGLAVATSSGFGDGEYPVYVTYEGTGRGRRVASLTIVFIPEQVPCDYCGYMDCSGCDDGCGWCGDSFCDGECMEDGDE